MSYIVSDENGESWFVAEGDPGYDICKAVADKGFRQMVVPTSVIVQGLTQHPAEMAAVLHKFQQAYGSTHDPDLRAAFRLYVRMYDCLLALSEVQ